MTLSPFIAAILIAIPMLAALGVVLLLKGRVGAVPSLIAGLVTLAVTGWLVMTFGFAG